MALLRRVRTLTRFPSCIDQTPKLLPLPVVVRPDGTNDPSGMDYAMKWWWRVRRWRFSHTSFIAGGAAFGASNNEEFYAHDFSRTGGPPQQGNEGYLKRPCDGDMTFHSHYEWSDGGSGPPSWNWTFSLFLGGPSAGVGLFEGEASIAVGVSFLQEDSHILQSSPSVVGEINSPTSTPEIYIDGVRIPLMYKDADDGEWSGRVDFTPIEFWPYPLPDGSEPIYDTVTGQVNEGRSPHEARLR